MGHTKSLRRKQIALEERAVVRVPKKRCIGSISENENKFEDRIFSMQRLARRLMVEVGSLMIVGYPNVAVGINFYEEVRRFEINLIQRALIRSGGHQKRAASLLGLQATTLHSKIKQYDIKVERDTCASGAD